MNAGLWISRMLRWLISTGGGRIVATAARMCISIRSRDRRLRPTQPVPLHSRRAQAALAMVYADERADSRRERYQ